MKTQKYKVELTDVEVEKLSEIVNNGAPNKQKVKRAKILLQLNNLNYHPIPHRLGPQEIIANRCDVNTATVYKISKKFSEEGLEATLNRKKSENPPRKSILTGEIEARIIALACSEAPEGYSRWTLRLLEEKVVELGIIDEISDTTIGRLLKKQSLNLT